MKGAICKRSLKVIIMKRKASYLGHVLRRNGLQRQILEGAIAGARGRSRPRNLVTPCKEGDENYSYVQLVRAPDDRQLFHRTVEEMISTRRYTCSICHTLYLGSHSWNVLLTPVPHSLRTPDGFMYVSGYISWVHIWILDWVYRIVRIFHPGLEPILSPNVHRWGLVFVLLLLSQFCTSKACIHVVK